MLKSRNSQIIAGIIVLVIGMIAYKMVIDSKAKKATGKNVADLIKSNTPVAPVAAPAAAAN